LMSQPPITKSLGSTIGKMFFKGTYTSSPVLKVNLRMQEGDGNGFAFTI
jgi:hypothetical protein